MTPESGSDIGAGTGARLKGYLCLGAVIAMTGGAHLVPETADFDRAKVVLVGILASAILLWSLEVLDAAVSALLVMVAMVLNGIAPLAKVWGEMGDPILGLIVAVYVVAFAVKKSGLDRRIALAIIAAADGRAGLVLLAVMATTYVFAFFIPTAMGRAAILLSVAGGLTGAGGMTDRNLLKGVFIGIPYVSLLASSATITGASGMVYAAGLYAGQLGFTWSYMAWLAAFTPIALVTLVLSWVLLLRLFPPQRGEEAALAEGLRRQRADLGKMTPGEWKVLAILLFMLGGWMTHGLHGLDTATVALVAAVLFFLPGIEIIHWRETAKAVNWGSLVLFACGLALAEAMAATGLAKTLALHLAGLLDGAPPWATAAGVVLLMALIRLGLNNITSALAVALPVVFSLAPGLGVSPVWLGMVAIAGSCLAFLLPSQSIATLASYGMRHFAMSDLRRAGVGATALLALAIVVAALLYWPLIGYSPT